jgi:hypothetical protein
MKRILLILCILVGFIYLSDCKDKKKENKSLQAGIVTFSKGDIRRTDFSWDTAAAQLYDLLKSTAGEQEAPDHD